MKYDFFLIEEGMPEPRGPKRPLSLLSGFMCMFIIFNFEN